MTLETVAYCLSQFARYNSFCKVQTKFLRDLTTAYRICNDLLFALRPLFSLSLWWNSPKRARAASFFRFVDRTLTHHSRTPLGEWSARRRDLYLQTHNTHKRQTSMPPAGFEPTIPAIELPQTLALGCEMQIKHSFSGAVQRPVSLAV
jgi:hypothetical protein